MSELIANGATITEPETLWWEEIPPAPLDDVRATDLNKLDWIETREEAQAGSLNTTPFCLRRIFEGDDTGINVITREDGKIMVRRFSRLNKIQAVIPDQDKPIYTNNPRLFLGSGDYPGSTVVFDKDISLDSERINATILATKGLIEAELQIRTARKVHQLYGQLKTQLKSVVNIQIVGAERPEYLQEGLKQAAILENLVRDSDVNLPEKKSGYTKELKSLGVVLVQDWGVSKLKQPIPQDKPDK